MGEDAPFDKILCLLLRKLPLPAIRGWLIPPSCSWPSAIPKRLFWPVVLHYYPKPGLDDINRGYKG